MSDSPRPLPLRVSYHLLVTANMSLLVMSAICQVYLIHITLSQYLPGSPCPGIFKYELANYSTSSSHHSPVKGVITVQSSLPIFLKVRLQIPVPLFRKYEGWLEVVDPNAEMLTKGSALSKDIINYNLYFPPNMPTPKIILIEVNSKVVCASTPISSRVITTVTMEHSLMPVISETSVAGKQEEFHLNDFGSDEKLGSSYFGIFTENAPSNGNENIPSPLGSTPFPEEKISSKLPFPKPATSRKLGKTNLSGVTCGTPILKSSLVLHVTPTRGDWPWMVPLFKKTDLGLEYICSSTLVSENFILTAAHCLKFQSSASLSENDVVAYVGRFNLRNWGENYSQPRDIKEMIIHPDYDSYTLYSDIALLRLHQRVAITPYANPACVWSGEEDLNQIVGRKGIVFGWGLTGTGRKISDTPKLAVMPIVSQEDCLRSRVDFVFLTSDRTLCAGFRNGIGPCNGDSGGGLMLPQKNDDGSVRWYLRGVTSLTLRKEGENNNLCNLEEYTVFTDVAKYQQWLSKYI